METAPHASLSPSSRPEWLAAPLAVLIAAVVAVLANTVISLVARAAGASDDFAPLSFPAYTFFTVIGLVAGVIGWLVVRRTRHAARTLGWLVPTVLAISLVPDVLVGVSGAQEGTTWTGVVALMLMHVVVTACAVVTFRRLLPVE